MGCYIVMFGGSGRIFRKFKRLVEAAVWDKHGPGLRVSAADEAVTATAAAWYVKRWDVT